MPTPEPLAGQRSSPAAAPTPARILEAAAWTGIGHVASQASWYGSLLVLAALLPPADFGTVAVAMVVVQVGWFLVNSGIGGSIIVARRLSARQVRSAVAFNIAIGVALAVLVALLADAFMSTAAPGGSPAVMRMLAVGIAVHSLAVVPLALIQKRLEFRSYAAVMVGSATIAAIVAVALGFLEAGVWALVVRQLLYQSLIATFAWTKARRLMPADDAALDREEGWAVPRRGALGFLVLTLTSFLALNVDYLVIGRLTDATQVGLYALAFTIAFAPLTQIAGEVGRVFLSATAATYDVDTVAERTLGAMRVMAALLLPVVPAAIALAPVLVPAVLGAKWEPMVAPLQILIIAGVAHAVLAMMGEALAGSGSVNFRAVINVGWLTAMVILLVPLVLADGIRGAAAAHLVMFAPLALVYGIWGSRRLGLNVLRLAAALRGVVGAVAAQAVTTTVAIAALERTGAAAAPASAVGALAGLTVFGALLWRLESRGVREGAAVVLAAVRRSTT